MSRDQATGVRYNLQDRPEFFKELRSRVNAYFKDNNISRYANWNMKIKTVFMVCLYFVPLALLLTGVADAFWSSTLMWVLMSFGMAGIGLAITHDANHMSYSRNRRVNDALGYLLNFVGAYHINWRIQHNAIHHSFTNVEGHDEDIETPVMRFSPAQKRYWIFRFQAFYAPFFYGLMTIYWFVSRDFRLLERYEKARLLSRQGLTLARARLNLIFNKAWYLLLTLVLPMVLVPLPWWQTLIGFLMMHFICGLILALIFQSAHVIEETDFVQPDEEGNIENNWAIHQMRTTANFANGSRVFTWLVGGLNFQIEHHLFPNICHIHYRKISKIVQKTAEEYGIPYHQHKTFFGALRSHFSLLNQLGTGKYDQRLAGA